MASNRENETLEQSARRVLVLQATLIFLLAVPVLAYGLITKGAEQGVQGAMGNTLAFFYGGLLGMAGVIISRRSVSRSADAALRAPQYAMLPVYMGLLNKLLVVGGGLAFGLVTLGLAPILVVSGYLVTQCALIWVVAKPS